MMDLSDGLSRDLPRLCEASGVGAVVDVNALPSHPSLADHAQPLPFMVGFGEEYELLFTASPKHRDLVEATSASFGTNVSRIGRIQHDPSKAARLTQGEWPPPLFSHFTERHP